MPDCKVPHAPNAAAANDADGGCGIRVHLDGHLETEVTAPRLDAERLNGALDQAVEFAFCGAQSDGSLRARPVLDQDGAS